MKITVIKVEVGEQPYICAIDDSLGSLQKEVGGYIEMFSPKRMAEDGVIAIIDEEGKLKGKAVNAICMNDDGAVLDVLCGPILLVKDMGEDIGSLSNEDIMKYLERFSIENRMTKGVVV